MDSYRINQDFSKALEDEEFEEAGKLLLYKDADSAMWILRSVDSSLEPSVHLFLEYWCQTENTALHHGIAANYLLMDYNYKLGA
jgi:hypothetical protein